MNRDELAAMTNNDIRAHAEVMGVKLGALDNKATMIDKITGSVEPEKPRVKEDRLPPVRGLHTLDGKKIDGKKYKLKIFATENDRNDVDIIVNGYNIRVQRGQEVIVDEAYVEVLRNAVIDTVVQDPETGDRIAQTMMVYPHQAVPV
jgi:hypothetical protein